MTPNGNPSRMCTLALLAIPFAWALTSCGGGSSTAPTATVPTNTVVAHTYPKNSGPAVNPHKGWNSGWWNNFPESTVGFQYVSWGDFEPRQGEFDFAKVEAILGRPGSVGRHFILRLYGDWAPSDVNSNCPDWLFSQLGVKRLRGDNGSYITDYNDPNYVSEAVKAIQALAQRYNDDPRVHAFELGLLGYWGEWHTSGFSSGGVGYAISDTAKNAVISAYKTYFTKVQIQGRYPWREPLKSAGGMGFHNDYFVPNNGHSDEFDTALNTGGQWLNGPIGGEAPPRDASVVAAERQALFATAKGDSMITTGRYSTMQPGAYRVTQGDAYYDAYLQLHRKMGYNFQIESANFPDSASTTAAMPVQLLAKNTGVAPFYWDWTSQFALLNSQDEPVSQAVAEYRLSTVKPGDAFTLSSQLNPSGLAPGSYRLAVRLFQPGADQPKAQSWPLTARNTYILFANDLPTVDGNWASNQALKGGWSVLGTVTLR